MERQYHLMYRLGIKPWDRGEPPPELRHLTEGSSGLTPGTALDLGCGTGSVAAYLSALNWDVDAVDISTRAISIARRRSTSVRWHVADVARLAGTPALDPLLRRTSLIVDVGCLHGLTDSGRQGWAETVNAVAADESHLMVWAGAGSSIPGLPKGISGDEINSLLDARWRPLRSTPGSGLYAYRADR